MEPQSTTRNLGEPTASAGDLRAVPLTWPLAEALSLRLTSSETMECLANGLQPSQALASGLLFGVSWAVLKVELKRSSQDQPFAEHPTPVGAYGFTHEGVIWSLWGPLSRKDSVAVLKLAPEWIAHLVALSRRSRLKNMVHADNAMALAWLQKTDCINLDLANPRRNLDGTDSYAFETFLREDPTHV